MFFVGLSKNFVDHRKITSKVREKIERFFRTVRDTFLPFYEIKYTKPKRPWKLLYSEQFETRSLAVKRESQLKSLHRKDLLIDLIRSAG